MGKELKDSDEVERLKAQIHDLKQARARDKTEHENLAAALKLVHDRATKAEGELANLPSNPPPLVDPDAPQEGAQLIARATTALMDLPADSELRKAVLAFMDSLIENYKDGPGAPGRAAFAILTAAGNPLDTAYKVLGVMERTSAVAMANSLKAAFR
jgi:hypothetical protein